MCGIVGILNLQGGGITEQTTILQMLEMIRHRGPDGFGFYRDEQVALGSARLSIIDLSGGDQPIGNEGCPECGLRNGPLWIVFNGEIFNYIELRRELEARGHHFATSSDTEVILHLYADLGHNCLRHLNGQFAFAIWDAREQSLFLARDRLGVRPLYYTLNQGRLIFGSEIKALLACPGITAEIDSLALEEVLTYWSTLAPRTIFRNIVTLPPAHYLRVHHGQLTIEPYWQLDFTEPDESRHAQDYQAELEDLLVDATRLRLRADVPVGAYLSGGLDSSITTAIIRKYTDTPLDTFSIAFIDSPEFDESLFQRRRASALGTEHHVVECTQADIARVFPEVVWHTEMPILRTAPAPMFLLSQLVHDHHFKGVVTGEGADEFLAGYDIFKEMQVRRFWAKNPDSDLRPLLLRRLYPDITTLNASGETYLRSFFKRGLSDTGSPYYSHAIRWNNAARIHRFLLRPAESPREPPALPPAFKSWSHLAQAQYLEISIFLSEYLLSSQGDRVAMAHSIEGRFPFLDYRVVEFCNQLPANLKLRGMTEKWLLKQLGRKLVPAEIWQRPKRPYRAPIQRSFFHPGAPEYVHEQLSETALRETELFDPSAVQQLARKAASRMPLSEVEQMALAGILSTQLVHAQFVKSFKLAPLQPPARLQVVNRIAVEHKPFAAVPD